jgi:hypothetical protein
MEVEGKDYIPFPENDIHRRLDDCLESHPQPSLPEV